MKNAGDKRLAGIASGMPSASEGGSGAVDVPESALDAVMSRAVTARSSGRRGHFEQWYAYLPGTALPTVWRETSATALAALRGQLRRDWEPTVRSLMMHEAGLRERAERKRRAA